MFFLLVGCRGGIMDCNSEVFRCRHMFGFYRGGLYGWCLLRWVFVCVGEGGGEGQGEEGQGGEEVRSFLDIFSAAFGFCWLYTMNLGL